MSKYQTKIITSVTPAFLKEWQSLWNKSANPTIFNSVNWYRTCQSSASNPSNQIIAVYANSKLSAVFPLTTGSKFGLPVRCTTAPEFLVDSAFLVESFEPALFKALFSEVFSQNTYLSKIDSQSAQIISKLFPLAFFTLSSANPLLFTKSDPHRFLTSTNLRQLKRVIRNNSSDLKLTEYSNTQDLQKYLKTIFSIDTNSAKSRKSMDIFSKSENTNFFTSLIKYCPQFVRIFLLTFKNIPIGYQFGFVSGEHYDGYQTSYLPEYRKLSPGKIMTYYVVQKLYQSGIKSMDFGGGMSTYKREFTPDYRILYDIYFSEKSYIIRYWKLINLARKINQQLFPKKYTLDHQFLFTPKIIDHV